LFSFFIVMGEWSLAFFTSLLLDPNGRTNRAPVRGWAALISSRTLHYRAMILFLSPLLLDSLSLKAIGLERCSFFNGPPSFSFGYRSPHTTTLCTPYI
jgi:hypothetical protein